MKLLEFVIEIAVKSADAIQSLNKIDAASDRSKSMLNSVGDAAIKIGKRAAQMGSLIVTAATPALTGLATASIEAARSAQEAASKFETVLGAQTKATQEQADKLAKAQGRSKYQTRASIGDLSALASGYGLTGKEASDFALKVQGLGVDLASFHEKADVDAIAAIRSAMAGEFEPLATNAAMKLSAEQINAELKILGISKDRATNADKLRATLQLIQKLSERQKAAGDAKRTRGSNANLKKAAEASKYDAQVEAGLKLAELDKKVQILKGDIAGLFLGLGDGGQKAVLALGGVVIVLGNLGTLFQAVVAWKLVSAGATTADTAATAANTVATTTNTGSRFVGIVGLIAAGATWVATTAATIANTVALWANTAASKAWAAGSALLAGGARIITTAFNIMKVALLTNPIIAIIAAIAFAAYLIYSNWDTIGPYFQRLWAMISAAFTTGWNWIKSTFNAGMAWLQALPGKFTAFGQNIMSGLVNGITNGAAWVKAKIFEIAGNVGAWFKETLGINSPSRVFLGFGGNITDGLADGIKKGQDVALRASEHLAALVSSPNFAVGLASGMASMRHTAGIVTAPAVSTARTRPGATGLLNDHRSFNSGGNSINVNGAKDPLATARAVRSELQRVDRGRALGAA